MRGTHADARRLLDRSLLLDTHTLVETFRGGKAMVEITQRAVVSKQADLMDEPTARA
jgi:ABC-type sugar transport system ATPase subunit